MKLLFKCLHTLVDGGQKNKVFPLYSSKCDISVPGPLFVTHINAVSERVGCFRWYPGNCGHCESVNTVESRGDLKR